MSQWSRRSSSVTVKVLGPSPRQRLAMDQPPRPQLLHPPLRLPARAL